MATDVTPLILDLSNKCGANNEAAPIIAALAAAWADTMAKLAIAEGKLELIGGTASESLHLLGTSMHEVESQVRQADAQVADLHQQITTQIQTAAQLANKADTAMQDVLKTYVQFNGNVKQLKQGVAGLAKAAINTMAPGASAIVGDKLDRILGVA
jgi:methyl-accepting chemotaxis protein